MLNSTLKRKVFGTGIAVAVLVAITLPLAFTAHNTNRPARATRASVACRVWAADVPNAKVPDHSWRGLNLPHMTRVQSIPSEAKGTFRWLSVTSLAPPFLRPTFLADGPIPTSCLFRTRSRVGAHYWLRVLTATGVSILRPELILPCF